MESKLSQDCDKRKTWLKKEFAFPQSLDFGREKMEQDAKMSGFTFDTRSLLKLAKSDQT